MTQGKKKPGALQRRASLGRKLGDEPVSILPHSHAPRNGKNA
jgi:hypothetical protein